MSIVNQKVFIHLSNQNKKTMKNFKEEPKQERTYSQEEVIVILQEFRRYLAFGDDIPQEDWFEQFKK